MSIEKNIAVIILAAGRSSRLRKIKQNLPFHNGTLLECIVRSAKSLNAGPVITVLGANASLMSSVCNETVCVINNNWEEGMGNSINYGVRKLTELHPDIGGTIITVCDQPYVTDLLLENLIQTHSQTGLSIVACSYANTIGTPVYFSKTIFPELLQLDGDKGAKHILYKDVARVATIDFPLGEIDIDTEKDYEDLVLREKNDHL